MTANDHLPFELNSAAVVAWMESISSLPQIQAAQQASHALKLLKEAECPPGELMPLLISMSPLTLRLANNIATIACDAKAFEKSSKLAKLSMQLLRQLSLMFCQIAEHESLNTQERPYAIYYALQFIGYSLRCYSLFYEVPSATLWKKSALLYNLAAEQDLLHLSLPIRQMEFKQHCTIEEVIKRNLFFTILIPTLHPQPQINSYFQLANQYASQLSISTAPENWHFGFYWDLNDEIPPCTTRKSNRPLPEGFLAIDTRAIGLALQQQDMSLPSLNHTQQNKLALQLTNYDPVFDSIIPGQISRWEFLFGFNDVSTFLSELNKLQKIQQLSGATKTSGAAKRNLALIPMEREKNAFETMCQMLAKNNATSKTGNVLKISHDDYLVAEGNAFDCKSGDIAIYYRDQEPAVLAIIRQQSALSISNVTHILLEKIRGFYSIYSFKIAGELRYAIVIDEDSDSAQVFLPTDKYNIGSKIPFTTGQSIQLTACLEGNSYFSRFHCHFEQ